MKKLTKESKVKTRNGFPARIICDDARGGYPFVALLKGGDEEVTRWYTDEGIDSCGGPDFDLIEVSAYDDFKIDDPVMVRDTLYGWVPRYFAGIDSGGRPKVFAGGATSFTGTFLPDKKRYAIYDECRRPTEAELNGDPNEPAHAR